MARAKSPTDENALSGRRLCIEIFAQGKKQTPPLWRVIGVVFGYFCQTKVTENQLIRRHHELGLWFGFLRSYSSQTTKPNPTRGIRFCAILRIKYFAPSYLISQVAPLRSRSSIHLILLSAFTCSTCSATFLS